MWLPFTPLPSCPPKPILHSIMLKIITGSTQNRTMPVHTAHIFLVALCAILSLGELCQRHHWHFTEVFLTCLILNKQREAFLNLYQMALCTVKHSLKYSQDFQVMYNQEIRCISWGVGWYFKIYTKGVC